MVGGPYNGENRRDPLRQWTTMSRVSLDFNLADSGVTETLGRALAQSFPGPGAVMYLNGELGAGKTTCVRSLLRALGVTGLVRSPTYTLVETYTVPGLTCVHVDLYRLRALTEVDELGLRDLVGPGCLLLVEWPDKGTGALPPADLDLMLTYAGDARQAHISPRTTLGSKWTQNLGTDTSLSAYVSNLT
jgi:tRNA threonylcarbamoyladenosine biosynthesis protein TsaE